MRTGTPHGVFPARIPGGRDHGWRGVRRRHRWPQRASSCRGRDRSRVAHRRAWPRSVSSGSRRCAGRFPVASTNHRVHRPSFGCEKRTPSSTARRTPNSSRRGTRRRNRVFRQCRRAPRQGRLRPTRRRGPWPQPLNHGAHLLGTSLSKSWLPSTTTTGTGTVATSAANLSASARVPWRVRSPATSSKSAASTSNSEWRTAPESRPTWTSPTAASRTHFTR